VVGTNRVKEPSLVRNRAWWLLLLLVWTAGLGLALKAHLADIHTQATKVALEGARNMFQVVELTRNWNANRGGVYVPVTPSTQPNPHLDVPNRDVTTTSGVQLTMVNPAYMTRMIAELAESNSGAIFRLTSLKPIRPENAPDDWERQSLQAFEAGIREIHSVEPSANGLMLRYMAPLRVKESCMLCHAKQGYKVGDIRGGISISQPYTIITNATQNTIRQSLWLYFSIWLAGTLLGWLLLELLRRRWVDLVGKIRELEETRSELVRSEKMASLGRMVAGFAHEINTPVGIGVGAVSHGIEALAAIDTLLKSEEVSEEALRKQLDTIQEASQLALGNLQRAADMVHSFKQTSVDQSSDQEREFRLPEFTDDVFRSLHNTFKRTRIHLVSECQDISLKGPAGVLVQVLDNLILNSFHHAFKDGTLEGNITIRMKLTNNGQLELECQDDGAGIDAHSREHLFEPFFTTRRGQGGSGLGLYIVYNLVHRMPGGDVTCESTPGHGALFRVVFGPGMFHTINSKKNKGASA